MAVYGNMTVLILDDAEWCWKEQSATTAWDMLAERGMLPPLVAKIPERFTDGETIWYGRVARGTFFLRGLCWQRGSGLHADIAFQFDNEAMEGRWPETGLIPEMTTRGCGEVHDRRFPRAGVAIVIRNR